MYPVKLLCFEIFIKHYFLHILLSHYNPPISANVSLLSKHAMTCFREFEFSQSREISNQEVISG